MESSSPQAAPRARPVKGANVCGAPPEILILLQRRRRKEAEPLTVWREKRTQSLFRAGECLRVELVDRPHPEPACAAGSSDPGHDAAVATHRQRVAILEPEGCAVRKHHVGTNRCWRHEAPRRRWGRHEQRKAAGEDHRCAREDEPRRARGCPRNRGVGAAVGFLQREANIPSGLHPLAQIPAQAAADQSGYRGRRGRRQFRPIRVARQDASQCVRQLGPSKARRPARHS